MRLTRQWLVRAAAVVRRVVGAPDYDRYVQHMRQHHPERAVLDPREFARDCLARRYDRPGSRCC